MGRVEQDLIGSFGEVPVDEVDSGDVLAALRKIEARGAIDMARRVKNYARDIFRFARAAKLRHPPLLGVDNRLVLPAGDAPLDVRRALGL